MKPKLPTFLAALLFAVTAYAQNEYSDVSLYAGYGSHGFNARLDLEINDTYFSNTSTRFHLELGGQTVLKDRGNFTFSNIAYPSDSRVMSLGGGVGQEFNVIPRISVQPFIGLRAEFVRFKDRALIDAIGENGIQRYKETSTGRQNVGPVVENGYGNAAMIDIGARIGCQLTETIEMNGTVGFSPIEFDTTTTLFGQYWGEAPHLNSFYVERKAVRFEVGLRYLLY